MKRFHSLADQRIRLKRKKEIENDPLGEISWRTRQLPENRLNGKILDNCRKLRKGFGGKSEKYPKQRKQKVAIRDCTLRKPRTFVKRKPTFAEMLDFFIAIKGA